MKERPTLLPRWLPLPPQAILPTRLGPGRIRGCGIKKNTKWRIGSISFRFVSASTPLALYMYILQLSLTTGAPSGCIMMVKDAKLAFGTSNTLLVELGSMYLVNASITGFPSVSTTVQHQSLLQVE